MAAADAANEARLAAQASGSMPPTKMPGQTNTAFNARITQWYKNQEQPTLTPQQAAAGATVQFVRTGAGGVGEYKIVYPIGTSFNAQTGAPTAPKTSITPTSTSSTNVMTGAGSTSAASTETPVIDTAAQAERQSAYDLLYSQFNQYGLGGLVEEVKGLITQNVPASELAIRLTQTPAYQQRFSANQARIASGLRALTPAEYIGLEDQYQNIMRNYGLPASYYMKDSTGKQPGFDKFLAGDVSAAELEDRIMTAQNRVINANPEVANALKQFYPDITNGDILAYTLDPTQGLEAIKRKVTAAEIGGAAMAQGLGTSASRAEELARYGVTKQQAQQGFEAVAQVAPRGGQLAAIYGQDPYTQATAETEIFNLAGSAEAGKQRKKLTELEQASFSKQSGLAQGALARDRAGAY